MDKNNITNILHTILEETFDDESVQFSKNTSRDDIESWDSLGHIRLLTAIEEEFKIKFNLDEIENISTIQQIEQLISEKI